MTQPAHRPPTALAGILVLAAGLALAAGCGDDTVARPPAPEVFVPLQPGTTWSYEAGGDTVRTQRDSVAAPRTVAGREYRPVVSSLGDTTLVRMDSTDEYRVLLDTRVDGTAVEPVEGTLFDFHVEPGAAWTYDPRETDKPTVVTLVDRDLTVTVPAGTFTGAWRFRVEHTGVPQPGGTTAYTVVPGVGIVRYDDGRNTWDLTAYRLGESGAS